MTVVKSGHSAGREVVVISNLGCDESRASERESERESEL